MFIKTAMLGDVRGSYDSSPIHLVKFASRGLIGHDRQALIKTAGESFVDRLTKVAVPSGYLPVYAHALGATEFTGPNKNGDGFSDAECKDRVWTFEKHARLYSHHRHKDPKTSYGKVKVAHYDPDMGRVQLLMLVNNSKDAAEKDGNLYRPEMVEKYASGDVPVSMSAAVDYDQCDICNNKAKSRKEYCGAECPGGGCKSNLGRMAKDGSGRLQFVHNAKPTWFDLSDVGTGADRAAFGFEMYGDNLWAPSHVKAASVLDTYVSPEVVESLYGYNHYLVAPALSAVDSLVKAAAIAQSLKSASTPALATYGVALDQMAPYQQRDFVVALADARMPLPIVDYCQLSGLPLKEAELQAAEIYHGLPAAYSLLQQNPDVLLGQIKNNAFELVTSQRKSHPHVTSIKSAYSLDPGEEKTRLRQIFNKTAHVIKPVRTQAAIPNNTIPLLKYAAIRVLMALRTRTLPGYPVYLTNMATES